jgi:hypothetical protein
MSGFQNTRYGSQPNKYLIAASVDTPVMAAETGMVGTHDQPISLTPVTANATEVYSRNKAPKNVSGLAVGDQFKVNGQPLHVRIIADGVKGADGGTPFDSDDISALINLFDIGDQTAVDADEELTLRNVVLINGQPITPLGNDGTVANGDFLVIDNASVMELYLEKVGGGVYAEGTCIDVYMDPAGTEITTTVLPAANQGVPQDGVGAHFWRADNDVVAHREFN